MKVYELMELLKNLPAGMDVRAMDREGSSLAGYIERIEKDGETAEGLVTLIYTAEKE